MKELILFFLFSFSFLVSAQNQEGKVSVYSDEHVGRTLASGDRFSKSENWASHEQLPINSIIEIKNPKNGQKLKLSIKDRGPYKIGFITQIPAHIAKQLNVKDGDLVKLKLIQSGKGNQKINYQSLVSSFNNHYQSKKQVSQKHKSSSNSELTWQIASFSELNNAKDFIKKHQKNFKINLYIINPSESIYKICAGKFSKREKANQVKTSFKKEYQSAFIYKLP